MSEDDVIAPRDDGVAELARNRRRIVRKFGKHATIRVDVETYCVQKIIMPTQCPQIIFTEYIEVLCPQVL